MKLTWKIWLLIIVLFFSAIMISPNFQKGVIIKSVDKNSTAFEQGLKTGMIITSINNQKINNFDDYKNVLEETFTLDNQTKKIEIVTKDSEIILYTNEPPEITVFDIPKTNIKTGLDLSGGSRALIKAKDLDLSSEQLSDLIDVTNNRLNAFGIADVSVKPIKDLS